MKIVLKADVENLGEKGALVDVANGYARNYLVPRGLALVATKGTIKQAEAMRRNRAARAARDRAVAEELARRLVSITVRVPARAGAGGKLFGSVTSADIASAIFAQTEIEVDKRKITLVEPLKELGAAEVPVALDKDVRIVVAIEVVAE